MKLKILTWNIAWGYGFGSDGGPSYRMLPYSHFESSLSSVSEFVHNLDIDIVFLQEVDFASARSHDIPELDFISRKSGLLYRSHVTSWEHPYVPFPGLLPARQFGRIRSGGGILSRYPIRAIYSELLPKPKENGAAYNWFYLNRYLQIVEIQGLRLCNLHLEAFSKENRELHLVKLQNRLVDYEIDIAGGDFNGSIRIEPERAEKYEIYASPSPTFPSHDATEVLDGFVIQKNRFRSIQITTLNSGEVSDHFPVLLEVDFDSGEPSGGK